jgi:hypothetical protein
MKRKMRVTIGLLVVILTVVGVFIIRMKRFADDVNEDALKKKDFNNVKLSDSTTMILKRVE